MDAGAHHAVEKVGLRPPSAAIAVDHRPGFLHFTSMHRLILMFSLSVVIWGETLEDWARRSDIVAAVNVTARYAQPRVPDRPLARLGVRLWDQRGGSRMIAQVSIVDAIWPDLPPPPSSV